MPGRRPAPEFLTKYREERGLRSRRLAFWAGLQGRSSHAPGQPLWPPALKTTSFHSLIFPGALAVLGLFLLSKLVGP